MGNAWAEVKDILPESDPHHKGTIRGPGGKLIFWMTSPRPAGISYGQWEAIQQAKWDMAFGRKVKK